MREKLTSQQESRFRRAYRETFTAENHGDAIKAMYAKFSALYGVSVDSLRFLVAEEWRRDPQQYHRLQSQLAARRAAAQGQKLALQTTSTSAKAKAKPEKPTKKQQQQSKKKKREARKLRCPVCRKSVSVTDNGCLKGHHGTSVWCRGSGQKVTVPAKSSTSGPDRRNSSSVRTISGGLPGLGRSH